MEHCWFHFTLDMVNNCHISLIALMKSCITEDSHYSQRVVNCHGKQDKERLRLGLEDLCSFLQKRKCYMRFLKGWFGRFYGIIPLGGEH